MNRETCVKMFHETALYHIIIMAKNLVGLGEFQVKMHQIPGTLLAFFVTVCP